MVRITHVQRRNGNVSRLSYDKLNKSPFGLTHNSIMAAVKGFFVFLRNVYVGNLALAVTVRCRGKIVTKIRKIPSYARGSHLRARSKYCDGLLSYRIFRKNRENFEQWRPKFRLRVFAFSTVFRRRESINKSKITIVTWSVVPGRYYPNGIHIVSATHVGRGGRQGNKYKSSDTRAVFSRPPALHIKK